jgi:D-arginine dehydrogenase
MVNDVEEQFYWKPDAGRLLLSPGDESPSPACDAQAEEMDIAIAVDRVERATMMKVRRILQRWAGLRSFAPDRTPVVGFDPLADGFFWLAGQGGYGIQTSAALGPLAASLAAGDAPPGEAAAEGVNAAALSPARLR